MRWNLSIGLIASALCSSATLAGDVPPRVGPVNVGKMQARILPCLTAEQYDKKGAALLKDVQADMQRIDAKIAALRSQIAGYRQQIKQIEIQLAAIASYGEQSALQKKQQLSNERESLRNSIQQAEDEIRQLKDERYYREKQYAKDMEILPTTRCP